MLNVNHLAISAALVAGALTLSPQAANQTSAAHDQLFPVPIEGLTIGAGEDYTLEQLVNEFARVTGENVLYSAETQISLAQIAPVLHRPMLVAPGDVYSVVQDILIFNRFVVTDARRTGPRMLSIVSMDSPLRASIKQDALFVPEDELDDYAMDSALLITTAVSLPNLNVRTLGNALRQLVVDPNMLQLIPVQDSHQVIATGIGKRVQEIVEMLRALDRGAARADALVREQNLEEALINAAERLGRDPECKTNTTND